MDFSFKASATIFISILFLVGCGGGSSSDSTTDATTSDVPSGDQNSTANGSEENQNPAVEGQTQEPLIGVFIDSAVEGLSYSTPTQAGTTNAEGEFSYLAGEVVTFQIGATVLGSAMGAEQLTPVDIASDANSTVNVARLLQSLDGDGNPDNGIVITDVAMSSTILLDFSLEPDTFSTNVDVINLVANSGSTSTSLIGTTEAIDHLESQIGPLPEEISSAITDTDNEGEIPSNQPLDTSPLPEPSTSLLMPASETFFGEDRGTVQYEVRILNPDTTDVRLFRAESLPSVPNLISPEQSSIYFLEGLPGSSPNRTCLGYSFGDQTLRRVILEFFVPGPIEAENLPIVTPLNDQVSDTEPSGIPLFAHNETTFTFSTGDYSFSIDVERGFGPLEDEIGFCYDNYIGRVFLSLHDIFIDTEFNNQWFLRVR